MTVRLNVKRWWYAVPLALLLQACGGGGGAAATDTSSAAALAGSGEVDSARLRSITGLTSAITSTISSTSTTQWTQIGPISDQDASRVLTQATFGPTPGDVASVKALGYGGWLNAQFAKPLPNPSHLAYYDARNAEWMAYAPGGRASPTDVSDSFWKNAISGQDQLRQRVAFALSEIFVVSLADSCGSLNQRSVSDFLDTLDRNAFGNFRQLLEAVALHPMMGCYLSHVHNQKDDPVTGRVPDENFAREVMQLFSVGLHQLNADGTPVIVNGEPVPTYGPSDIAGMARIFTGFSWVCPMPDDQGCFLRGASYNGMQSDPDAWVKPMRSYDAYHSTAEKQILGKTLAAQGTPDPWASLRFGLDTLAQHPNVGPFIGKQLIQRLVTSNPSPAYVARVAKAFKNSNGSMREMVQAILLDPEARDTQAALTSDAFGKVREPVLRLTALLRACEGRSTTGNFMMGMTQDTTSLSQAPMNSPSVFNFFRPGYVPPGSVAAVRGMVAPEMQIANETSVTGYVRTLTGLLSYGMGSVPNFGNGINGVKLPDVYLASLRNTDPVLSSELRDLAATPDKLIESINQRLLYGTMSSTLRADLMRVMADITDPRPSVFQPARVSLALLITLSSPEFVVQR